VIKNCFDRLRRWALAVALWCVLSPLQAETLTFAPLPLENREAVIAAWKPLLDYLEQRLKIEFRIAHTDSYADLLERMARGEIDLAYLGPLPYVELKKRLPEATPIVHFNEKDGQAKYTCALFASSDAKIALKGLIGKKIALTQPLSTCGYLAASGLLRQAGADIEKNRYRYLGKHDAVLEAVAAGAFDLGAAKTAIGRKYASLGVVALAETPPFPGFALVAHGARLSGARQTLIRRLIVEAPPDERARWGEAIRYGAVAAQDGDYDALRALLPSRPIPEKGNF